MTARKSTLLGLSLPLDLVDARSRQKILKRWPLSLAFVSLLCVLDAQATLIEIDDPNWGVGSIIEDTTTGLDWLKPAYTVNQSYDIVSASLGSGNYAGFRYASQTEVQNLFADAGMPLNCCYDGINNPPVFNSVASFVTLFGQTYVTGTGLLNDVAYGVSGLTLAVGGSSPQYALAQYSIIVNRFPGYSNGTQFGNGDFTSASPTYGSWLIRGQVSPPSPSIPLPPTLALMGIGLAGISLGKRCRLSTSSK